MIDLITKYIRKNSYAEIEYVVCVDSQSLKSLDRLSGEILIPLAVRLGPTRLIDNVIVRLNRTQKHASARKKI